MMSRKPSLALAGGKSNRWLAGGSVLKTCIFDKVGSPTCLVIGCYICRDNSRTGEVCVPIVKGLLDNDILTGVYLIRE